MSEHLGKIWPVTPTCNSVAIRLNACPSPAGRRSIIPFLDSGSSAAESGHQPLLSRRAANRRFLPLHPRRRSIKAGLGFFLRTYSPSRTYASKSCHLRNHDRPPLDSAHEAGLRVLRRADKLDPAYLTRAQLKERAHLLSRQMHLEAHVRRDPERCLPRRQVSEKTNPGRAKAPGALSRGEETPPRCEGAGTREIRT